MREATAEIALSIPDYVANIDVYNVLNACAKTLEKSHITAVEMVIFGLDFGPPADDGGAHCVDQ